LKGTEIGSGLLVAESLSQFHQIQKSHSELFPANSVVYPFLSGDEARGSHELARHKILDLLGDLALLGLRLPSLSMEIHNGGHEWNHRLVERLRPEVKG
jgi:hypothetical protein